MLTIGQLSARTGVARTALRYYDELGLVRPAARTSGQRRYDDAAVRQVAAVLLLRDLGFTLAEVAQLLAPPPRQRSTWQSLAHEKVAELDRLIAAARVARTALAHGLECPAGDPSSCPKFWSIVDRRLAGRPLAEAHDDSGDATRALR